MIVMKFGGASTHTVAGVRAVAEIVDAHRGRQPLIVVSAIGKTTRAIDRAARLAANGEGERAAELCREIVEAHRTLAHASLGPERWDETDEAIAQTGFRLSEYLQGIAIVRELSARSLDACLVQGEHLAAAVLSRVIPDVQHVPAESVMVTDGAYGRAAPRMDLIRLRAAECIAPRLASGACVMTEGYVGATDDGTPTTMGMESSDYTATLLGAILNVEEVQIWTNVDGIMTVDPRLYARARTIPLLTYDEAEELAALGAKILHPRTIGPLRAQHTPLTVRNSMNPHGGATTIHDSAPVTGIKGIAVADGLSRADSAAWQHAGEAFAFTVSAGGHTVSWRGAGDVGAGGETAVSLVGKPPEGWAAILRSMLDVLGDTAVHGVLAGCSDTSATVMVSTNDAASAVEALHRHWLDQASQTPSS